MSRKFWQIFLCYKISRLCVSTFRFALWLPVAKKIAATAAAAECEGKMLPTLGN